MNQDDAVSLTISSVKRVHGVAVLTLSNGESRSMPRAMLRERPYKAGMPFDIGSFDEFLIDRSYAFALDKAISLLAGRARTQHEIFTALKRNAYPELTIARVMAKLHEAEYLNDAAFAEQWVSSRALRGMGRLRIRTELRQKGVSHDHIDAALSAADTSDVENGAIRICQKYASGKNLALSADRQKVISALVRRGYDYTTAKKALAAVMQTEE